MEEAKKKKVKGKLLIALLIVAGLMLFSIPFIVKAVEEEREFKENWYRDLSKITVEFIHKDAPENLVINLGNEKDLENATLLCYNNEWASLNVYDKKKKAIPYVKIKVGGKVLKGNFLPERETQKGYLRYYETRMENGKMRMTLKLYKDEEADSTLNFMEFKVYVKFISE